MGGNTQVFNGLYFYDDFWVLKLDTNGNVSWEKTFGGQAPEVFSSIEQTSDEGYIVAGRTQSFGAGSGDAWVIKLDAAGNISWQKTYGGPNKDDVYSIKQTSDGGYVLTGTQDYSSDHWILKLDDVGNVLWQKTYTTSYLNDIQQTPDGYIAAGSSAFGVGISDIFILKLDENGEIPDPECDIVEAISVTVNDTGVVGQDTAAIVTPSYATSTITEIIMQDILNEITIVCSTDYDDDGVLNPADNCPRHPNGPDAGTCTKGHRDSIGGPCMSNVDCGANGFCSMNQEDSYPPDGNGCGDACECEGNFDCDNDCDGTDAATFKADFGRSSFNNSCPPPF